MLTKRQIKLLKKFEHFKSSNKTLVPRISYHESSKRTCFMRCREKKNGFFNFAICFVRQSDVTILINEGYLDRFESASFYPVFIRSDKEYI